MEVEFHTVDVFTDRAFAGNQVAVVPDATGLTGAQMQAIAAEFGYSATAYVLPPHDRGSLARVRVFTPRCEVPFAGQPSVGTAFVLGRLGRAHGRPAGLRMVFEAKAGPVLVELMRDGAKLTGAAVRAPLPLELGPEVAPEAVALCAGLACSDICTEHHAPVVASVGVPFVLAELRDMTALARARPCAEAFAVHMPLGFAKGLHLYVRNGAGDRRLSARTFAPLHGIGEDSATGSANAALAGLLATLAASPTRKVALSLAVSQGEATGRPGLIEVSAKRLDGAPVQVWIKGHCAPVMRGQVRVPEQ
ncbi:MAG: PhzF family phenazine biosynthesis protein [Acetobacteraceae bacterium]|nr:PhzF family phenazine biosynthesis protein [Acetobacteraceae bacterium]